MAFGYRKIFKALIFFCAALYPAFVYYFLAVKKIPLRHFSLFVIAFALFAFIGGTTQGKGRQKGTAFFRNSLLLLALGILCFFTNSQIVLKFYPLLMNFLLLAAFASTCFFPPNMIFRFATIQDKSIKGSLGEKRVEAYCRKVTIAWCVFFIFNGSVAAWTIFFGSDAIWSLYNGGISYILIGIFFTGEFVVRKMAQKNIPKAVPLSKIKNNSRPLSAVMCYEGVYNDGRFKTWGDFLEGTAILRKHIISVNSEKWLLYCDDYWHFLLAFTALLQCKKEVLLSANVRAAYIAEIRAEACGDNGANKGSLAPFLTDMEFSQGEKPDNTFSVKELLESSAQIDLGEEAPQIAADETSIIMYTSGSTGKPKLVKQRLTEFENDNKFVISKWGDEFLKRKLCSTVNQHHIYGLLFDVLLPFTAGVPFRRKRIEFPEEFEKLTDTQYMIITVPAFLKRAVEIEKSGLSLKSPWIFTSGGVLNPPTAKKTSEIFGFWPLEVYGSTETSGIAYRQSFNGLEWTPFDNAKLSKNEDGCLVIRSPYIKDPAGFVTADMVEMLDDGRFLLKGRLDSVVKIEEKRISLAEIENRILQSGLVSEACVISLEDKRQYLAAALVFNNEGKQNFDGLEKHEINKFWNTYLLQYFENILIPKKWRYLEKLPVDAQGKKKREDIELLFSRESETAQRSGFESLEKEKVIEKKDNTVLLEFSIPQSCPYFDGHFPGFPILPAVAQIEIVIRFASRYLQTNPAVYEIRKAKFSNIVRPSVPLLLKISASDSTINFSFSSPDGKINYSSGCIALENK